jgi:hypothetical protein
MAGWRRGAEGFVEAVSWLGPGVLLSLFMVGSGEVVSRPPAVGRVRSWRLEDPDRGLGDREVYEHDLSLDGVPGDLPVVVERWLVAAVEGGAEVAWFGFEGSFHFDHLLTRDIAPQLYGVADRTGVYLAVNDVQRRTIEWARRVEDCGQRLWPQQKDAPGN